MPKKPRKTMIENLRDEVEVLTGQVAECQAKADLWNDRLFTAQQELNRAQNALAALEGTPQTWVKPAPKVYPDVKIPLLDVVSIESRRGKGQLTISEAREELAPAASPVLTKPNRVMFNGVEIELEPGFRVGKNSFGEDVLIPQGMPDLPPMEEPTSVRKPDFSLPAVGSGDRFANPEDLY